MLKYIVRSSSLLFATLLTLGLTLPYNKKSDKNLFVHQMSSLNTFDSDSIDMSPKGLPVEGIITSNFGMRFHPIEKVMKLHEGIDISVKENTPVEVTSPGKVIFTGIKNGYGKTIIIEHSNIYRTLYAHLNEVLVKEGEIVEERQIIGLSGNTGRTTAPHVHYEIIKNGKKSPYKF